MGYKFEIKNYYRPKQVIIGHHKTGDYEFDENDALSRQDDGTYTTITGLGMFGITFDDETQLEFVEGPQKMVMV